MPKLIVFLLIIFTSFELYAIEFRYRFTQEEVDEANKLYYQCDGENWKYNKGWPLTTNGFLEENNLPNGIYIIKTYNVLSETDEVIVFQGAISSFYLGNNNLKGTIPDIDLPELKELDLSRNELTGSIPNFYLPKLYKLNLIENQLTGKIPNFTLPELRNLFLSDNQLTGNIPDFYLPLLEKLYLDGNHLTGNIPDFNLPLLEHLNLEDNRLTGNIPNFDLPLLEFLILSENQLTGNIPDFDFPELRYLFLSYNNLSGDIPDFNLPKLYQLKLLANSFSFEALEVNLNKYDVYEYNYQDLELPIKRNGNILSVVDNSPGNIYLWKFNGYGIEGANNKKVKATKKGFYRCTVTNTLLPGLVLETANNEVIKLSIDEELNKKISVLQDLKNIKIINDSNKKLSNIRIYNLKGDLAYTSVDVDNIIDLSMLSSGFYLVTIQLNSDLIVRRILLP